MKKVGIAVLSAISFFALLACERNAQRVESPVTIITAADIELAEDEPYRAIEISNVTTRTGNIEFTWVSAGTFQMGTDDDEWRAQPAHQVVLSQGFFMGIAPVTQAQWAYVMSGNTNGVSATPSHFHGNPALPVENVSWYDVLVFANRLSVAEGLSPVYRIGGSTNPYDWGVVPRSRGVAWDAVEIAAGANGFRLPTEAQWEYAARAGTTTTWSFGNEANTDYIWFSANSNNQTQEVRTRPPNPWGLYDMHGNVWEWVWDWFGNYPAYARTDPMGAVSGDRRGARGGSWSYSLEYTPSAHRGMVNPFFSDFSIGFRLVRPE
ncbi:MAG: formylglycine-generating enzyme family protein [Spirochaetes bacterium]|nr:formylglycine-generating enzyme family protein [Spirochaetota bacterium]